MFLLLSQSCCNQSLLEATNILRVRKSHLEHRLMSLSPVGVFTLLKPPCPNCNYPALNKNSLQAHSYHQEDTRMYTIYSFATYYQNKFFKFLTLKKKKKAHLFLLELWSSFWVWPRHLTKNEWWHPSLPSHPNHWGQSVALRDEQWPKQPLVISPIARSMCLPQRNITNKTPSGAPASHQWDVKWRKMPHQLFTNLKHIYQTTPTDTALS